jgi:DNA-binding NarL/FixJ family response regulator
MMAIKVLIYEDNISLRKSIETLLLWDSDFDVVAALSDAAFVKEDVTALQPDVILMDIDMPNSNGVNAVTQIRKTDIELPIVMFTVFEDDENIFNAIRAGANGYLLKKNFDQIPASLKDVLDGGAPMTSSVAKKVLNFIPKNNTKSNEEIDSLSKREAEILEHITQGYSYKMIGEKLFIATETVRTHIKRIYKKLQVNSATEAVYKFTHTQ